MVALLIGAAWGARIHLESLDAPDLNLSLGSVAVTAASSDPLATEAVAGVTAVLRAGGVEVVPAGDVATLVVGAPVFAEQVQVGPATGGGLEAVREARIQASWRLVDRDGTVLDELADAVTGDRWWSAGQTSDQAVAGLVPADQVAAELARSAGAAYGHRLVSVRTEVTRRVYGGGPLREGAFALKAGDTRRALVSWIEVANHSGEPRIVARAHHDLAVAHEMLGEYGPAVREASAAATIDPAERPYLEILRAIQAEHRPLLRLVGATP